MEGVPQRDRANAAEDIQASLGHPQQSPQANRHSVPPGGAGVPREPQHDASGVGPSQPLPSSLAPQASAPPAGRPQGPIAQDNHQFLLRMIVQIAQMLPQTIVADALHNVMQRRPPTGTTQGVSSVPHAPNQTLPPLPALLPVHQDPDPAHRGPAVLDAAAAALGTVQGGPGNSAATMNAVQAGSHEITAILSAALQGGSGNVAAGLSLLQGNSSNAGLQPGGAEYGYGPGGQPLPMTGTRFGSPLPQHPGLGAGHPSLSPQGASAYGAPLPQLARPPSPLLERTFMPATAPCLLQVCQLWIYPLHQMVEDVMEFLFSNSNPPHSICTAISISTSICTSISTVHSARAQHMRN